MVMSIIWALPFEITTNAGPGSVEQIGLIVTGKLVVVGMPFDQQPALNQSVILLLEQVGSQSV